MIPDEQLLIVDDEQHLLSALRRLLRRRFRASYALGGPAALSIMRESGPYAVILTDMRMPQMDGLAFIAGARRVSPTSVYLMLTGNCDEQTELDARRLADVHRVLRKPCELELLEAAILDALAVYRTNTTKVA